MSIRLLCGIVVERRVERGRVLGQGQDVLHFLDRAADQAGDVLGGGVLAVVVLGLEVVLGAQHLVQLAHHVHRQAHRARLVHDGALDALADPPGGVGGKAETALGLELVDRAHQADVALLDQVEQHHAAVDVVLGDRDDQAQVMLDHLLARAEVAGLGQGREVRLLLGAQQRLGADRFR
jgi:hypothetical protein